MAGRNKVADGIKVDSQVQEIILHYLSGPAYSQRPLKVKGKQESQRVAMLLVLKMEKGAISQGMYAASRSWKRQGNRFSPKTIRKQYSPVGPFLPSKTHFRLLNFQAIS